MSNLPQGLIDWARQACDFGDGEPDFSVVAGDASSRRYFRASWADGRCILVDSPPATEKNTEFLERRLLLEGLGVRVPTLLAADPERGYFALEDLGDHLLLAELAEADADVAYAPAFAMLKKLAAWPGNKTLDRAFPAYDRALLTEELSRFPEWFVEAMLGHELSAPERNMLDTLAQRLIVNVMGQPRVLVHRDFHSRNLMCLADGDLALIDFQDAVVGPVTYDLVSLLRDCYICWPESRVRDWVLSHRDSLVADDLLAPVSDEQFLRWHDLQGLQRHIKVLGTFARLYLRDGKSAYLEDLPQVVSYVEEVSARYAASEPAVAAFRQWFRETLGPLMAGQPWGRGS